MGKPHKSFALNIRLNQNFNEKMQDLWKGNGK